MMSPAVPSSERLQKLRPPFAEIPELSKILSLKPLAKLKWSHHCDADNTALISSRQAKPLLDRRASRCWSSLAGICLRPRGFCSLCLPHCRYDMRYALKGNLPCRFQNVLTISSFGNLWNTTMVIDSGSSFLQPRNSYKGEV